MWPLLLPSHRKTSSPRQANHRHGCSATSILPVPLSCSSLVGRKRHTHSGLAEDRPSGAGLANSWQIVQTPDRLEPWPTRYPIRPCLAEERMLFDQLKRREFITLLGERSSVMATRGPR